MDYTIIITGALSFGFGLGADWFKGFGAATAARRQIRNAVRAEIHSRSIIQGLNFYIVAKTNGHELNGNDAAYLARHLGVNPSLTGVDYYHQQKPDMFNQLPEWISLQAWSDQLSQVHAGGQFTPLFNVITLIRRISKAPLNKCLYRKDLAFVRRILARPEVESYWTKELIATSQKGFVRDRCQRPCYPDLDTRQPQSIDGKEDMVITDASAKMAPLRCSKVPGIFDPPFDPAEATGKAQPK